jgi:hypothetical protein
MPPANDPKPQSQASQAEAQSGAAAESGQSSQVPTASSAAPGAAGLAPSPGDSPGGRADIERAVRQAIDERIGQMGGGPGSGGPPVAATFGAHPFLGGIHGNMPEFVAFVARVFELLRQGQGQGQGGATRPAP